MNALPINCRWRVYSGGSDWKSLDSGQAARISRWRSGCKRSSIAENRPALENPTGSRKTAATSTYRVTNQQPQSSLQCTGSSRRRSSYVG